MQSSQYICPRRDTSPHEPLAHASESVLREHRRRFAHAIVRPPGHALLLNKDNTRDRWCPIEEAVATGRPFTVEVGSHILALDCDDPSNPPALWRFAEELGAEGVEPVVVASGQPGRLHLFARVVARSPEDLAVRARACHLDVRRSIRPPLAPHRLGYVPRLLQPADVELALHALQRPHQGVRRSLRMRQLLEVGDQAGRYSSRSEVIQALALAAVNTDLTFERFFWELCDPRNGGGGKVQQILQTKGESAARRYAKRSWDRAVAYARSHPPIHDRTSAQERIATITMSADACPWRGQAGGTDRAILEAHIGIALRMSNLEYGASTRQVAEQAGVSLPTVLKAHQRLIARGWLTRLDLGRGQLATIWRLRSPDSVEGQVFNTLTSWGV